VLLVLTAAGFAAAFALPRPADPVSIHLCSETCAPQVRTPEPTAASPPRVLVTNSATEPRWRPGRPFNRPVQRARAPLILREVLGFSVILAARCCGTVDSALRFAAVGGATIPSLLH
jgi:hypothetical protein